MCFSATASFAGGALAGGVGVATLAKLRRARQFLLASLPLLFAIHQVEEGFVWLYLRGRLPASIGDVCIWLYVTFAHALIVALAPLSIWLDEPDAGRRRWMLPFVVLGVALCSYALIRLTTAPITAELHHYGIEYYDSASGPWWFGTLYVAATCTAPFLSSYRWMVGFGAINLCGFLLAAWLKQQFLTSIWCTVAALSSLLIYLHFRRRAKVAVELD